MTALTADLCARAVIAAARAYGDDPAAACRARSGRLRRCLSPAIIALSRVLGAPVEACARPFGVRSYAAEAAARAATDGFRLAIAAAEGALLAWALPLDEGVALSPPVVKVRPPTPPPAGGKPRVLTAGRVQREVMACLAEEPSTAPELAQLVGVSEAAVREALSALAGAGKVRCDALTAEGWRVQFWRAAGGAE